MILHARIDLTGVDMDKFEAYETQVIAMLPKYSITMVERLRAEDGSCEIHVLDVPDMSTMEKFRADPERAIIQHLWEESGATGTITEVRRIR